MPLADDPERRTKLLTIRSAAAKQKALLHDADKGAKCLNCKDCPGLMMHFWRKVCFNCRCLREDHDIEAKTESVIPVRPWLPDVFPKPPPNTYPTLKQRKAVAKQDPLHDHSLDACVSIKPEDKPAFEKLQADRLKDFSFAKEGEKPVGSSCARCSVAFKAQDDVVTAPRLGKSYHAACFTCAKCSSELENLAHYVYKDEIFCGRCHAERFLPRCAGCDELIFEKTYTNAEDKNWHVNHFCCYECDVSICDVQYAKGPHGFSCCLECYDSLYAPDCGTCDRKIKAGAQALKVSGVSFHKTEACFKCKVWNKNKE